MEHIFGGSVTHWSEIKGRWDFTEKQVSAQERMMRLNFVKKWGWLPIPKIRPDMPHWIIYILVRVYNTWSNEISEKHRMTLCYISQQWDI